MPPRAADLRAPRAQVRRCVRGRDGREAGAQAERERAHDHERFHARDEAVQAHEERGRPEQRRERCLVLELPREDDQVEFSVEHTQALAQRTTPLPRDPAFEPSLFTISVVISLDSIGNGKFLASHILSQQVTIKSGF